MTMVGMRGFLRNARGAAAAEMALILPLLVALLFLGFEGGYFLWNEHKVVKAVRDGARYAGRLSYASYDCDDNVIVDGAAETRIKNLTRTGRLTGGTPAIQGWGSDAGDVTVSVDCESGHGGIYEGNGGDAPRVTVSAAVPYPSSPLTNIAATLGFDTSGIVLRAEAQSPVMGL